MKNFFFAGVMILTSSFFVSAQDTSLTAGAAILFKDIDSKLSIAEKNEIFQLTEFQLAENQEQFHFDSEGASEFPFTAFCYPLDIDEDGVEEIAIQFGNAYTSGMSGVSYFLFVKNSDGAYHRNFGAPGFLMLSTTQNSGYADIIVAGPGYQPYPVWRWNGEIYAYHDKMDRAIADKMPPVMLSEASKIYMDSIKD